jgi:hypothetical protein
MEIIVPIVLVGIVVVWWINKNKPEWLSWLKKK